MEDEVIVQAIHEELGDVEINRREDYDELDMKGFEVDGDIYIIGDYDAAYAAAVGEAIRTFNDCYSDDDKVNWLQKWEWPGVDEESVCAALADDSSDYEDDEEPWQPSSINEYIDMMGYSDASDCFSYDFLRSYVNEDEVGEFVVETDGIANGLARYDGKETSFGEFYGYRVD